MWSSLLLVAVVGGCFLQVDSREVYKCKKEIIDKIKESWNGYPPNDILELARSLGKVYLLASSPKYIKDEYKGIYAEFTKEDGSVYTKETLNRIPKDGGEVDVAEVELIEAGGAMVGRNDGVYRYPVYYTDNIIACYSCSVSDKATEGSPAGFIIAPKSYSKDKYEDAKSKLEDLGVKPLVEYCYD